MKEKANILIVDDDLSLCKTMSFILSRKGYAVSTAKNGPEALEKVKESAFDIIFLDIKMPIMDGVEAFKRIKRIRADAVVMMMTAYAVEDLVQDALREGAYGIIYKPVDTEKVIAIVEEVTGARQGALIQLVDDDEGICVTLKNILVKKGYEVVTAHTGEEAITMAKEKAYGIIFIDMKLPTLNGLETFLAIKEINPEVVAIMMTAYRQEMAELVEEALKNRAYSSLYKPIDMEVVLRLIEEILKRKQKGK
jgi:DNA-binding NtrC family response regulator